MESLLGVRTIRENLDDEDIKIVYANNVKRAKISKWQRAPRVCEADNTDSSITPAATIV